MRNAKEIMQFLKGKGEIFYTKETERCINAGLTELYLQEEVVNGFVEDTYRTSSKFIYLLTNMNRLIVCIEEEQDYVGINIFKTTKCVHYAETANLNALIPERTSYNVYKEKGLFGAKYAEIKLYFNGLVEDNTGSVYVSEAKGQQAYDTILEHAQEYGSQGEAEEEPEPAPAQASGGKEAEMKQIREMFDAGIITKEEMMELMKSLLSK